MWWLAVMTGAERTVWEVGVSRKWLAPTPANLAAAVEVTVPRQCYDHFVWRQGRPRVHWHGAQPPHRPIDRVATVKELTLRQMDRLRRSQVGTGHRPDA